MTHALTSSATHQQAPPTQPSDRDEGGSGLLLGLVVTSVAVHLAIFGGLGSAARVRHAGHRARPHSAVDIEVAAPRAAVASPPPTPAQAPARPLARSAVRHAPARSAPMPVTPAAPVPEAPADFSGVTLTNDGPGPGWASATGDGHAMTGPIGRPGAAAPARAASPPDNIAITPLASLSRPPTPPDLNATLEAHYPAEARRQGLAGRAVLRARIAADGHTRDLVLLTQTADGFGDACRAVLREAIWTAPLDRSGRPVSTVVTYTCNFDVR